jgi:hypothetical protein
MNRSDATLVTQQTGTVGQTPSVLVWIRWIGGRSGGGARQSTG